MPPGSRVGGFWLRAISDPDDVSRWIETADRPTRFAALRVTGQLGMSLVFVLFPALGPNRLLVAALLTFVSTPLVTAIELRSPPRRTDRLHLWHDIAAVMMVASLLPSAWTPALVVGAMLLATAAAAIALWEYLLIGTLLIGGLAGVAAASGVENVAVPLACVTATLIPIGGHSLWYRQRFNLAIGRTGFLIRSANAVFFEVDRDTSLIVSLHGQVEELLGQPADELIGTSVLDQIHPADHPMVTDLEASNWRATVRHCIPGRAPRWLRFDSRPGVVNGRHVISGVAFDVTELETSKRELRRRAERDPLTGLQNRDVLSVALAEHLDAEPDRVAVTIIDLDGFKRLNDTLGHPAGDEFLRLIGRRIGVLGSQTVRVGRLGGDEFGMIIVADDPELVATRVSEAALEAISETIDIDGVEVRLTASIGIAVGRRGATAADLLRDADIAMYQAKRGRTGVHVFSSRPEELTPARLSTGAHLTRTLEDDLEIWFQVIVDLRTGETVGVEGLARWPHPELGVLTPSSFLPSIDQSGLSERLDWFALTSAADFAVDTAALGRPIEVAVNMSVAGLRSPQLLPYLRRLARDHLEPGQLKIEISERDIDDDLADLLPMLQAVRRLGFGLSLDDYGTGFSSLIRLRDMPFTEVKIDRSFVAQACRDRTDAAIVRSTVDLASELGLTTVAEGVESHATAAKLRDLGCHRAQGFLYAYPRPAADVLADLSVAVPEARGSSLSAMR